MSTRSNSSQDSTTMSVRHLMSIWLAFSILLVLAPLTFSSATAVSLLSQIGTAMIFGLSYNMLLGQGGMLSFGHAAFFGLGSFTAVHFMNLAGSGAIWMPLPLIPVVGGLAGLLFAALIGYVITQKSGTTFAMITLGIGQMVFACALMFPVFFGGEGGVSTNRVYGEKFFGLSFGSQLEVYYLIAFWLLLCTACIYAFTRTPLGRIVNAVRDNAERAAFIGYDPRLVRYLSLMVSAGFAGIAGALNAINFEIASAENLSLIRSGDVLLFTFIGGVSTFIGPMVGAIVGVLMTVLLSDYSQAWHMYLGLLFVLVVVYMPEGVTSLQHPTRRLLLEGLRPHLLPRVLVTAFLALLTLVGTVLVVELLYHRSSGSADPLSLFSFQLDHQNVFVWLAALTSLALGGLNVKRCARWMWEGIDAAAHTHDMNLERSPA